MGIFAKIKARKRTRKPKKEKKPEAEMTFLEHLEELRWHLVRSIAAIVVFAIGVFINVRTVIDEVILFPFQPEFPMHRFLCAVREGLCFDKMPVQFITTEPYEQFLKSISVSLTVGFIISFPYFIWEMWRFIRPGLHDYERKNLKGTVFITSVLFFMGVAFAYYIIAPFSAQFLANYTISGQIDNQWKIGKVITMVTQIVIAGGILFELPIIIYYLSKMGLITPSFLRTYRRHAIVILLLMAAIVTPPDVLSQVLIFIPLFGLYEISIYISAVTTRRREKEIGLITKDEPLSSSNGSSGTPGEDAKADSPGETK